MNDPRLREILHLLDPPAGEKLWYGGASVAGTLRGVTPGQAAWRPSPKRHSIWELTLHIAYWKYAVRRNLDGSPEGSFPRSPSNWPAQPEKPTPDQWKHRQLVKTIREFEPRLLDETAPGSKKYRFVDLLFGIVSHDLYHVGQIQLLKRLYDGRSRGKH